MIEAFVDDRLLKHVVELKSIDVKLLDKINLNIIYLGREASATTAASLFTTSCSSAERSTKKN
jgi:hypothetical protein